MHKISKILKAASKFQAQEG